MVSCAWAALVAWLIVRAIAQRNAFLALPDILAGNLEDSPNVSVVVPARNEAGNIGRCLASLAAQSYPKACLSVIVVDDHSEDETLSIAASIAETYSHVQAIGCPALPQGWKGKPHACWIGAKAAPPETEWLCFIDADVEAGPDLIAGAVCFASGEGLGLLSLAPRQELKSFAERLVMPCGFYSLAFRQDIRRLEAQDSLDASVTGQFMLIRRQAYDAVEGHAAVSHMICEDAGLARLIKQSGFRAAFRDGGRLLSTRMYTGWSRLWQGLTKNLVDMLGGQLPLLSAAFVAVTLGWAAVFVPCIVFYRWAQGDAWSCWALGPALAASAAVLGFHIAGARHFRIPLWYGLLFPLGYSMGAVIAADSVVRRRRGRVVWKGRVYSA
ncbi:glycosyltransferase [Methylocystis heyeri]|nr:glycosyltransferase family A protein [Methylocystis heyeri]